MLCLVSRHTGSTYSTCSWSTRQAPPPRYPASWVALPGSIGLAPGVLPRQLLAQRFAQAAYREVDHQTMASMPPAALAQHRARNKSSGASYSPSQMTYDLRRLRLNGLVRRIPHTHTYALTPDGTRIAIFYTKLYNRLLRPLAAADQPQAPPALRQALTIIDRHVDDYIARARLKHAA